jgi:hypothetical protein
MQCAYTGTPHVLKLDWLTTTTSNYTPCNSHQLIVSTTPPLPCLCYSFLCLEDPNLVRRSLPIPPCLVISQYENNFVTHTQPCVTVCTRTPIPQELGTPDHSNSCGPHTTSFLPLRPVSNMAAFVTKNHFQDG